MKRFSVCLLLFVTLVDAASAGILYGIPRGNRMGRRYNRVSTTPLRQTNPKLTVSNKDSDVTYYFNFKKAEEQYEKSYIKYEQQRFAKAEKRRRELERYAARARRANNTSNVHMMNASAVEPKGGKEITRDPRAWFNSRIAGSFGPRPGQNTQASGKSSDVSKPLRSSTSLLDGTEDVAATPAKKEGLWSKFLRVLGIKK